MDSPRITVECRELSKSFGGLRAVDDVTVDFEAGRVTALIGPNGAGKTTLFHLIAGTLRPDRGQILYRGRRLDGLRPWRISRLGIGRLFQDVRVFQRMTALDNVLVGFAAQGGENPLRSLAQPSRVRGEERERRARAADLLDFVGLGTRAGALAEDLSYGQQKLLAIARLLAMRADVLLLDEPTAGVSPAGVKALLALVRRLAEQGRTVLVIEHNMSIVLEVADWVNFLDEGQLVAFGLPQEVLADRSVRTAYLGL